jgi:tRNA pseudouridine38-40 synthase
VEGDWGYNLSMDQEGGTTYKLTLSYDGTDFKGWQRLPGKGRSVQEILERALSRVLGEEILVAGAGRTDAGVHALGQVASFHTASKRPPAALLADLNACLPADIAALSCAAADPRFHARHLAKAKLYRYRVLNAPIRDPHSRRVSLHVEAPLDLDAMRAAAAVLLGRHNFQSFTNLKEKGKSYERDIDSIQIERQGDFLDLLFKADGFLHNQVRIMAGALIEAGLGRRNSADIQKILDVRDRALAPGAAPAAGLCLMAVEY